MRFAVTAFLSVSLIFGLLFTLNIGTDSAFAQPTTDPGGGTTQTTDPNQNSDNSDQDPSIASTNDDRTCTIDKVGWILCPTIEVAGKIGDQAFQFLSRQFLEIEPELIATSTSGTGGFGGAPTGTFKAWELARNIANIMFIVVFLVIILSQVTGRGLDNYGIKKTLPRLIIAAGAVNVSYFICQIMVDLSNILGYELQNFLVDVAIGPNGVANRVAMPPADSFSGVETGKGTLAILAAVALGGVAAVYLLPLLITGFGAIVAACILIIVVLLLRKAFIILLVVISPVAFVMYLLPNTEQYFRKWLSMFWKLLMVFPVVGLLFGAGQLASAVILVAGTNDTERAGQTAFYNDKGNECILLPASPYQNRTATNQTENTGNAPKTQLEAKPTACGNRATPLLLGLTAALIAVSPLLFVWPVLKQAIAGMGALGGKISGAVDTYSGKLGGKAQERMNRTAIARGMEARKTIKKNYQDQKFAEKMGERSRGRGLYTRIAARGFQGNIGRVVGGSWGVQDSKLTANFAGAREKLEDQELQERMAEMRHAGGDTLDGALQMYENAVKAGDILGAKAAESLLHSMGATGTGKWMEKTMALEAAGIIEKGDKMVQALMRHTRLKHADIKGTAVAIDEWATSNPAGDKLSSFAHKAGIYANLSGDHMLGQATESLSAIRTSMATATESQRQAIAHAAQMAVQSQGFAKAKVKNQALLYDLAGMERPDSLRNVQV